MFGIARASLVSRFVTADARMRVRPKKAALSRCLCGCVRGIRGDKKDAQRNLELRWLGCAIFQYSTSVKKPLGPAEVRASENHDDFGQNLEVGDSLRGSEVG